MTSLLPGATASAMRIADIDDALIRHADTLSPEELSVRIGGVLSPEQVAGRIKELLKRRNWLDAAEQDVLVTLKMSRLIAELEDQPRTSRNAEVLIRSLEVLGNRLEKRAKATENDLNTLYAWQAETFITVLEGVIRRLTDETPLGTMEATALEPIVESSLRLARLELEAYEASDD